MLAFGLFMVAVTYLGSRATRLTPLSENEPYWLICFRLLYSPIMQVATWEQVKRARWTSEGQLINARTKDAPIVPEISKIVTYGRESRKFNFEE